MSEEVKTEETPKHAGGRPPLYTNAKELEEAIDKFFEEEKQPTLAGLAYWLHMDRQTLYNYAKKDEFFDTIKKARDFVLNIYEKRLLYSDKPVGVIFALKNWGWKDRTDLTTNDKDIPVPIYNGKSTE